MRFASYATIVLSFFGAAVALPPGKRASVSDLKTDVHAAFFEINSIYDFLSLEMNPAIPPLLHASDIRDAFNVGAGHLSTATADVETITTLGEADAQAIFSDIQTVTGASLSNLIYILNKFKGFLLTAGGGSPSDEPIAFQGIQNFTNALTAFENSFVAIAPADLQGPIGTFFQQFAPGLAQVLATWSQ